MRVTEKSKQKVKKVNFPFVFALWLLCCTFQIWKSKKSKNSPGPPCKILKKDQAEGIRRHTYISTIYPLNGKSKKWLKFSFHLLLLLLFEMASKKVYFFLLFNRKSLLFVLLFKIPKIKKKYKIYDELHRHHMGIVL